MATPADPAALYPDIAAEGSLGAALQAAAVGQGLSVPVTVPESDPLRSAAVVSTVPYRRDLVISGWAGKRRWSIRGCESFQGLALVEGDTQDLGQIARAAQAWHDGAVLTDIRRVAPFVHLTGPCLSG